MPRIFRTDVKLTPSTVVAAWDPHNWFGDVSVKDVFVAPLKDVDFKGRGYRNLVIPEIGYATVCKTDDGYQVVDTEAEEPVRAQKKADAEQRRAQLASRDWDEFKEQELDKWDNFLNGLGYSYVGEEKTHGGEDIYYEATKSSLPFAWVTVQSHGLEPLLSGGMANGVIEGKVLVPKGTEYTHGYKLDPRTGRDTTERKLFNKYYPDFDIVRITDYNTSARVPSTFYKNLIKRAEEITSDRYLKK